MGNKNLAGELVQFLDSKSLEVKKVMPGNGSVDKALKMAVVAATDNPKILECTHVSIYKALMQTCHLGLSLSPVLNEAHLIPYGKSCPLQIGYRGWIKLMKESGEIRDVRSVVVYENDEFAEIQGLKPELTHVRANGPRGVPTHVYTVADYYDGYHKFLVMPWSDIQKAKQLSKKGGKLNPAWSMWEDEMAKKCPIKRMAKTMSLGPKVAQAAAIEDNADDQVFIDPAIDDLDEFIEAQDVVDADIDEVPGLPKRSFREKLTSDENV